MAETKRIELPKSKTVQLIVTIKGITPMMTNAKPERIRLQMEKEQAGKAPKIGKKGRDFRDFDHEVHEAVYWNDAGFPCVRGIGMKIMLIDAGMRNTSAKGTELRQWFSVAQEMIPINSPAVANNPPYEIDKRMVKTGGRSGGLMPRWRPKWSDWQLSIPVIFNPDLVSAEQMLTYFQEAGTGVGVGDYNVKHGGNFGMFKIESAEILV